MTEEGWQGVGNGWDQVAGAKLPLLPIASPSAGAVLELGYVRLRRGLLNSAGRGRTPLLAACSRAIQVMSDSGRQFAHRQRAQGQPQDLILDCPDDFHVHFRQGPLLSACVAATAHQFGRALAMPNTSPPLTRVADVADYRQTVEHCLREAGVYPSGGPVSDRVDHSCGSRRSLEFRCCRRLQAILSRRYDPRRPSRKRSRTPEAGPAEMEKLSMPLCIHGELPQEGVDVFDASRSSLIALSSR